MNRLCHVEVSLTNLRITWSRNFGWSSFYSISISLSIHPNHSGPGSLLNHSSYYHHRHHPSHALWMILRLQEIIWHVFMLQLCLWWVMSFLKPIQGSDQGIYFLLNESLHCFGLKKKTFIPFPAACRVLRYLKLWHRKLCHILRHFNLWWISNAIH